MIKIMPMGPAPYGFRWDASTGAAVAVPDETQDLWRVIELIRYGGRGNRVIAELMTRTGSMRRGVDWTAVNVAEIRRELKSGRLHLRGR